MKWGDVLKASAVNFVGILIAAAIVGQVPGLRAWINKQWSNDQRNF